MSRATSRHVVAVNNAVAFHRALWKLRAATGKTTEEVLALRSVPANARKCLRELRDTLAALRKTWPYLLDEEIIDVATTVTQAASLALTRELMGETHPKPEFDRSGASVHNVLRKTLKWMFAVSGREADVEGIVSRVKNGWLRSRFDATLLRDALIRDMPGILQWADGQPPWEADQIRDKINGHLGQVG